LPPLHPWLPDAYPRARIAGSVWLTAFTTKAAVYALARYFPGTELLAWAGAGMALYGVLFALLENDVRRLLAYHIVSQVGFMVAGIGIGTDLALDGASAHAFSHIFYKGLLMMCAGAVIHSTGREKLAELGGVRSLVLLLLFTLGAFSISGVPPFNGFVSKSMTLAAAHESELAVVELLLLVASVGTFLSITGKMIDSIFFGSKRTEMRAAIPTSMYVAMGIAGAVCIGTGLAPDLLYRLLPNRASYHPYSAAHFLESLEILIAASLGYLLLRKRLSATSTVTLDVDRLLARMVWSGYRFASTIVRAPALALAWCAEKTKERLSGSEPRVDDLPIRFQVAVFLLVLVGAIFVGKS
jgi:multicomponent Na+:H+ antiporter subunit D